ncbi:PIN domain-containing protein [Candidatus Bipolaricaulota bacterium]|nr:PIN domain-containing protein [Candidatus Bipolaricaulota bacterium]
MPLTLVDTSSWIEALRQDGDPDVTKRVFNLMSEGTACLCDMVILELWNGARGEKEKQGLTELEEALRFLPIDRSVWKLAKGLARTCRSRGLTIPTTDLLVFACAEWHGAELEHCDEHLNLLKEAACTDG